MNPLWRALLGPWEWRLEILLTLVPLTVAYVVGWVRLRRAGAQKLANGWRLAAYLTGMGSLAIALMSPIDVLGGQLFFMHMIQHKLTIMVSAPLIWLGNPFPIGVWGLPRVLRKSLHHVFSDASPIRETLAMLTQPFIVWLVFVILYIGWHDPDAYNLALRNGLVHDMQHLSFFIPAMFFWWIVLGAAPRIHGKISPWIPIVMLMGVIPFNAIAGFVIANHDGVLYTYYESVPRVWGFSAIDDQAIGGVIMWVPGSEMFFQAAGALLALMFIRDKRKSRLSPVSGALSIADDALIAPGLEHRALQNKWRDLAQARTRATLEAHVETGGEH